MKRKVTVMALVVFACAFCASASTNLYTLIKSRNWTPANYVIAGPDAEAHGAVSNPTNIFDGRTGPDQNEKRWVGCIKKGAYLHFKVPVTLGAVKLRSYKMWANITGRDIETGRIPSAWELLGITWGGVTNKIHAQADFAWPSNRDLAYDIEGDENSYIGFIWKPLNSPYASDPAQSWDVGLQEIQFFIDQIDPTLEPYENGRSLFTILQEENKTALITLGPSASSHADIAKYLPKNIFDGLTEMTHEEKRWLGTIYAYPGSGKTGGTYFEIEMPSGFAGVVPKGFRMWRHNAQMYAMERAPTIWKFYGVRGTGELVLLHEQENPCIGWTENGLRATVSGTTTYASSVFDVTPCKESFRKFRFMPLSSAQEQANRTLQAQHDADPTKPGPSASSDVGLAEFEIFVEWPRTPRGTVILIK